MKRVLLCLPLLLVGCVQPAVEVPAYKLGDSPMDYSTRVVREIDSCADTTCLRALELRMRNLQGEMEIEAEGYDQPKFMATRFNYLTAVSHLYATLADVSLLRAQFLNHEVAENIYRREKGEMSDLLRFQWHSILKGRAAFDKSPHSELL